MTLKYLELLVREKGGVVCLWNILSTFLLLQSTFLSAIPASPPTQRLRDVALRYMFHFLTTKLAISCLEVLVSSSTFALRKMVLISVLVTFLYKREELPMTLYEVVLEQFKTHILGSRVRLEPLILGSCMGMFKKVTHPLFKEYLLPAILKALLRNPDELMDGMCGVCCVCSVSVCVYLFQWQLGAWSHLKQSHWFSLTVVHSFVVFSLMNCLFVQLWPLCWYLCPLT